jgi:hypothetical protein
MGMCVPVHMGMCALSWIWKALNIRLFSSLLKSHRSPFFYCKSTSLIFLSCLYLKEFEGSWTLYYVQRKEEEEERSAIWRNERVFLSWKRSVHALAEAPLKGETGPFSLLVARGQRGSPNERFPTSPMPQTWYKSHSSARLSRLWEGSWVCQFSSVTELMTWWLQDLPSALVLCHISGP